MAGDRMDHEPESVYADELRVDDPLEPVLIRARAGPETTPRVTELVQRDAESLPRGERRRAIHRVDEHPDRPVS